MNYRTLILTCFTGLIMSIFLSAWAIVDAIRDVEENTEILKSINQSQTLNMGAYDRELLKEGQTKILDGVLNGDVR